MSNHSGSYLANELLTWFYDTGVTQNWDKKQRAALASKLWSICSDYDCNMGEILEGLGDKLHICYYCNRVKKRIKDDLCAECRRED